MDLEPFAHKPQRQQGSRRGHCEIFIYNVKIKLGADKVVLYAGQLQPNPSQSQVIQVFNGELPSNATPIALDNLLGTKISRQIVAHGTIIVTLVMIAVLNQNCVKCPQINIK